MSRRARWSLFLSCCGLAALVMPSAWGVLTAGAVGASSKASVGVTPEVALVRSGQPAATSSPERSAHAESLDAAPSHVGRTPVASRAHAAGAGLSAESARVRGADALAHRAR
jgi:hypothetical protein